MRLQTTQPSLLSRLRNPEDREAWAEFDSRYGELIVRYCCSRGFQYSDAEDVRQVVMLSLLRALPAFHYSPERGKFRHYLFRVVRNAMQRHHRGPKGVGQLLSMDGLANAADDEEPPDDRWEEQWVRHHYRLAIATIRETAGERNIAIFDALLAGESVADVALEFEMNTQAVHKVKQRLRDRLQEVIGQHVREEEEDARPQLPEALRDQR